MAESCTEVLTMKITKLLVYVLLFTLLLGCSKSLRTREYKLSSNGASSAKQNGQFYVIGAGDSLAVNVWKEDSLSGSVTVRPDGYITLPLINDVKAAGKAPAQLRSVLEEKYKEFLTNPFVTIRIEKIISSQVYVIGQIKKPGVYPFTGSDTVLQLVTLAGGLTIFAKRADIRVVRRNGKKVTEYVVDYDAILNGDFEQDIMLRPGDRIIVP